MRKNPKPAVALLESGEVERWFQANGWTYPARGPIAKGVAAVQQFFEGMGLSKPPQLQLSETEARYSCRYPEVARGQVTLRTTAKKWVYAHADSEASWLRVTTPSVSGPQQAVIQYEVDTSQLESGGLHEGVVKLVANAGQKLNLRVRAGCAAATRVDCGQDAASHHGRSHPRFCVSCFLDLDRGHLGPVDHGTRWLQFVRCWLIPAC